MNAHDLLKQDHRKVKELFQRFEDSDDDQTKQSIANQVVRELEVHTRIEEEIYYPAVREQGEQEMIQEAEEEHNLADILASQLAGMEASDPEFDAKFTVLAESVSHHIDEEEGEMFPKVEDKLGEDKLRDLGQRMAQRKEELMEEVEGMPQEFEEEARPRRTTRTSPRRASMAGGRRAGARRATRRPARARSSTPSRSTQSRTGARTTRRRPAAARGGRSRAPARPAGRGRTAGRAPSTRRRPAASRGGARAAARRSTTARGGRSRTSARSTGPARPGARRTTSGQTTRSTRGRSTSSSRGRGRSR